MGMGEGTSNRWWENYLVRYLMPSIAGVVIVSWLSDIAGPYFRTLLFLPAPPNSLDASALTLLFLYGNLFCYIASYPVLCFHASRVLDHGLPRLRWVRWLDAYLATLLVGVAALVTATGAWNHRVEIAFILVFVFSAFQCLRLALALGTRLKVRGLDNPVSPMFGFAYALARRRGVIEEVRTEKSTQAASDGVAVLNNPESDEQIDTQQVIKWRRELRICE